MSDFTRTTARANARALTRAASTLLPMAALLLGAFDAAAQTNEPTLDPVVVTAARIAQNQSEALPHTTVISRDAIHASQAIDLPTLLRQEAGVQFTQSGGPGMIASMFLRGAAPGQSLLLVDGVPVRRQGFAAAAALEHILPEQIDHIEIVRGNVSAIYGSGAIGGVIQIFTRHGAQQPVADVSVEAGSRGTYKLSGDIAGQSEGTRYALSLERFKTNGIPAMSGSQFPNENPDRDGDANNSLSGTLSHEWARGHEFGARLYANDAKFNYDGGGFGAPTDVNVGKSRQQSLALFSRDRFTPEWDATVTLSHTRAKNRDTSISAFPYDSQFESSTNLLQWTSQFSLAPSWNVTGGIDIGRERAESISDDGFSVTRFSPSRSTASEYLGINGKVDRHQMQANVRHDHVGGSGAKTTGYLGYGYAVTPEVKVTASASTAFNAPTLAQVDDPANGNLALLPETARSLELGAQYASGSTLMRATVFKTRTSNQFGIDLNECFSGSHPAGCPTFNIAQASNRGIEVSLTGTVGGTALRSSLTLQEPTDDATGKILIRRARTLASLAATHSFGALRLAGDLQYSGARPDGSRTLGAYLLANVNARYALTPTWSLFGRIDNLFDRDYQTAYGYNQPPRGAFIGVNWHQ